ncbi:PepSY domain-containing protein [Intestinimonas aquisgranensis]|nr:PepSY domain-containing protein [Intestinimonas aquisgranensis]
MKNQNRWKDMLAGALVVTAVAGLAVPALAATGSRNVRVDYSDIKLVINGETVTPKDGDGNVVEPFTIDGTTYLPVRAVANALGMDVSWNGNTNTVTLTGGVDDVSGDYIGKAKAKEVALDHAGLTYSDVSFVRVELDWDDGQPQYEVEFYAGNKEYDYEINAKTGKITNVDFDIENFTVPSGDTGDYISETKAKEIALDHAGVSSSAATFVQVKLDWDDGRPEYEVEFYTNGKEYDYEIDAITGDVRSYDYDAEYYAPSTSTGTSITESQAKAIVQDRAGSTSGTFREFKLDRDDGRSVYEGEYRVGWTEYDFEIDASTGTVLEWSVD